MPLLNRGNGEAGKMGEMGKGVKKTLIKSMLSAIMSG